LKPCAPNFFAPKFSNPKKSAYHNSSTASFSTFIVTEKTRNIKNYFLMFFQRITLTTMANNYQLAFVGSYFQGSLMQKMFKIE